MHVKAKPYRDTWAALGSQLFEALEAGDAKKAAEIYEACEHDRVTLECGNPLEAALKLLTARK